MDMENSKMENSTNDIVDSIAKSVNYYNVARFVIILVSIAIYLLIAFKLIKCHTAVQRLILFVIILALVEIVLNILKSIKYFAFIYNLFKKTTTLTAKAYAFVRIANILFSLIILYYVLTSCKSESLSSSDYNSLTLNNKKESFKYILIGLGILYTFQAALILPNIREKANKDITILDYSLDLIDNYESLINYVEKLDDVGINRNDIIMNKTNSAYYNEANKILSKYPNIALVDISPLYPLINADISDLIKAMKGEE